MWLIAAITAIAMQTIFFGLLWFWQFKKMRSLQRRNRCMTARIRSRRNELKAQHEEANLEFFRLHGMYSSLIKGIKSEYGIIGLQIIEKENEVTRLKTKIDNLKCWIKQLQDEINCYEDLMKLVQKGHAIEPAPSPQALQSKADMSASPTVVEGVVLGVFDETREQLIKQSASLNIALRPVASVAGLLFIARQRELARELNNVVFYALQFSFIASG